ncbi:hypothetical protein [Geodermatophilus sp. SYSU D00815]
MRTPRRSATLALVAAAGLTLTACSTTVRAEAKPVETTAAEATEPADPPVEETGATATPEPTEPSTPATGTGGEELPIPGAGVPGDAGLCQAVAGWYGYVGLALFGVDENGNIDPAEIVPLLELLRDAPQDHQDADAALLAAADDVSAATDEVIDEVEGGTPLLDAIAILDQPITTFGDACIAAGVAV